jgi:hypothetical protein
MLNREEDGSTLKRMADINQGTSQVIEKAFRLRNLEVVAFTETNAELFFL